MVIFHSYVSLPEGSCDGNPLLVGGALEYVEELTMVYGRYNELVNGDCSWFINQQTLVLVTEPWFLSG